MKQTYYICEHCGNIITKVKDTGVPVVCCGQKMKELIPGTTDGAVEKHVPVYEIKDNKVYVTVGSVEHPMLQAHYIEWVSIQTDKGMQRKVLSPGEAPKAVFALCDDEKLETIYEYCNLHGLWSVSVI